MKPNLIFLVLIASTLGSFAQIVPQNYPIEKMNAQGACQPNMIFTIAEKNPKYSGGLEKLENDLRNNLADGMPKKGKYFLKILINCKGEAVGFETMNGDKNESQLIFKELEKLQNWTAAVYNYQNVDCFFILALEVRSGSIFINNK